MKSSGDDDQLSPREPELVLFGDEIMKIDVQPAGAVPFPLSPPDQSLQLAGAGFAEKVPCDPQPGFSSLLKTGLVSLTCATLGVPLGWTLLRHLETYPQYWALVHGQWLLPPPLLLIGPPLPLIPIGLGIALLRRASRKRATYVVLRRV